MSILWEQIDFSKLFILQALQDDVQTLQQNVKDIKTVAQKLIDNAEPAFAENLKSQVNELDEKWDKVVKDSKQQNTDLKEAYEKSKKVKYRIIFFRCQNKLIGL